jgi:hypothetical protein
MTGNRRTATMRRRGLTPAQIRVQRTDLLCRDDLAECPDCHDLAHPSATVCEGCGQKLFPGKQRA